MSTTRALQLPGRQWSRTVLQSLFKNKHKIFNATIASCTMKASGVSPQKCHAEGCKSKRRQLKHPTTHFGWCLFSHTPFSPQGMGLRGVSLPPDWVPGSWGLFHSNHSPDGNDQALFPELSLTHLSFHSWQTTSMTDSVVLGSMSVSKAPVIPTLNGTLSSLKSEQPLPSTSLPAI